MEKIMLTLFICFALQTSGQNKKNKNYLKKCISLYANLYNCDKKYSENGLNSYQDCVIKYNRLLGTLLSDRILFKLKKLDLKKLSNSTGLKILESKDNQFKIVSWRIFNTAEQPSCSNILLTYKSSLKISSEEDNEKLRIDVQLDTIIDLKLKNSEYYLVMGTNKCGNNCTKKICSLFTIRDSKIIHCDHVFFKNDLYLSDLEIQYFLNENLKNDPQIKLDGTDLILPILSNDKMKVIGHDVYKIRINK